MADFNKAQEALRTIQQRVAQEQKNIFHDKEKLKKLEIQKKNVVRVYTEESGHYKKIVAEERNLKRNIAGKQAELNAMLSDKVGAIREFQGFTDPRKNIGLLNDSTPILMFPVRLETRFKTLESNDGTAYQLWVRIFPDECSIDTFDDTLSDSEVEKAKEYWASIWEAGIPATEPINEFVKDKHRGAWRKLMGHFNAGRAYWVSNAYKPEDEDMLPTRQNESDVILVIPTYDLPSEAEQKALQKYWGTYYLAKGNDETIQKAFDNFMAETGTSDEVASKILGKYTPSNIKREATVEKPLVVVSFVVFNAPQNTDSKLNAWTQAAEVRTFPERFVLLGYQNNDLDAEINQLGNLIPDPIIVGPDTRDDIEEVLRGVHGESFDELNDDEKAVKYIEYLSEQAETKWLFNFNEAVNMGLGFKVNLTPTQFKRGFSRLFVIGIKMRADSDEGQQLVEELFKNHQFGDNTFSIIPQGTPTNNTEEEGSGYSVEEDPDEAFDRYFEQGKPDDPYERSTRRDGRWLANMLGIDVYNSGLNLAENYYHTDQCEAAAMHTALWNATIGYYMESMLTPVASDWEIDRLRWFLINYVSGRGRVPSIRIDDQPYGILPATTFRNYKFMEQREVIGRAYSDDYPSLLKIYKVLEIVKKDWEKHLGKVAHVGKKGDAHQILLQALGLHATSVEYDRRVADNLYANFNAMLMHGVELDIQKIEGIYRTFGLLQLQHLGYNHDYKNNPRIPILEKSFLGDAHDLDKFVVDDTPFSEKKPIRPYTEDDKNYIYWLIDKAQNNHRDIKDQKGFKDNKKPIALLYDMLRHAINLEFGNTGLRLYQNAQLVTQQEAAMMRLDADFIGIQENTRLLESKWDIIYRKEPRVNDNGLMIADHISELIKTATSDPSVRYLQEVMAALEHLKDVPTARLERCFAEHLDCCYYRLDSWLMGFLHLQLEYMRFGGESNESDPSDGIYLGAYGLVENLRPENKQLEPKTIDEDLVDIFDPERRNDIMTDSKNAGYVHAPSINHGLTAAVLRNAYISAATPANAETYKVNLSSERVRLALNIIEGMQQGQSLGALLGYHLERGLHDNNVEEMDIFIYELRKVFSLSSNKLKITAIKVGKTSSDPKIQKRYQEEEAEFEEDKAITKIEANNVVDGLELLEHIRTSGKATYPFGFATGTGADKLMQATPNQANAINKEVQRIMNIRDAVADLAISESVHQVVQGNYDRAAGALDAYSKGHYPQLPHVIQSNGSGVSLTNRFGIHLPPLSGPAGTVTPRGITAPRINAWLNTIFPDRNLITCEVVYTVPNYDEGPANTPVSQYASLQDMGLMPIDLLYLEGIDSDKSLSALDDYILKWLYDGASAPTRLDALVEINYTKPSTAAGAFSFFEVSAMIGDLRQLVVSARPLNAADITLQNEAKKDQVSTSVIDPARVSDAVAPLVAAKDSLKTSVLDELSALVDDEDMEVGLANSSAILAGIDSVSTSFVNTTGDISLFGKPQSGSGYVADRKAAIYSGLYKKILEYKDTWDEKVIHYTDLMDVQLPAATSDEARINILQLAEAAISTTIDVTFTDVVGLTAIVVAKKALFDAKHTEIVNYLAADHVALNTLFAATDTLLLGLGDFDVQAPNTGDDIKQIVVLAEDIQKQAEKLYDQLTKNIDDVNQLITDANISADAKAKVKLLTQAAKLLFSEDFQVLPEFTFNDEQAGELQNCINDQAQLLHYQTNDKGEDFPVDNWLYGIARVREKLGSWENTVQLFEAFKPGSPTLDLLPIQLPYQENDTWLAVSYPESYVIESDKLIYTAYNPGFNPTQAQCGLLVDEWTEVIPAKKETTGMTFHYDRPNCEPPQTMLLMTPSEFTGHWKWNDIVNTLHDTLEMAQIRAVEPDHIDETGYAKFLPATVASVTSRPVTMALNYLATAITINQ
ncbi:hypothetical protein SAMN06265379_10197 [Saccharicrinis carchari]|uniref:Uncharacterized protein n=1 Tax=Saccharicrinis carchari TaxID=1168039 RepID=A0A521AEV1_SACCC|nr:hypothetical protein [Saccharicrinis carchari]SMO33322.1 hypothetical protein SAMN06265379_10197 [Saccharicrinis carchari]